MRVRTVGLIPVIILKASACPAAIRAAVCGLNPRAAAPKRAENDLLLTSHSLWLSGTIVIGLGTALSMLGPGIVRRYVTLERLTANNDIAGFKFATVGVLYAVLLAFAIIVVWQKFSEAETNVAKEAGAAETIYRLSPGLGEKSGTAIRSAVGDYLKSAIADDWPAMSRGVPRAGRSSRQALDGIFTLHSYHSNRPSRAIPHWSMKFSISSMS